MLLCEYEKDRLEMEITQLLLDIKRVGTEGELNVTFGELFVDEKVEQYYEALVGTLKSAKKRKLIDYKGKKCRQLPPRLAFYW